MAEQLTTQVAVVGAGPGGYAAAFAAADLGLQVALIDPAAHPGGVCLYRGCIPSKALLNVAKLLNETKGAADWGVQFGEAKIDLDKLRKWKDGVIGNLTGGLGQLTKARKIEYVQGKVRFTDGQTLAVDKVDGGTATLRFEHAILATGSRPVSLPHIALDSPRVMDSAAALELPDIPERLLVIGGGYIGLELATVYAALGSQVSVVEMTAGLLPGVDRDLITFLSRQLKKRLENVWLKTKVTAMEETPDGIRVTFEGEVSEPVQTFDKVLVSIGRRPNTENLGLENTKVELDEKGFVKVDGQRRTAEPSIFAIGDITGQPMLAHKASHEGRVAAEAISGQKSSFEPQAIPAVVFTDPEVAVCGLTESDAKEAGREVKVARFPWAASGRATTHGRSDGVTKLVVDPETDRVLGVAIVGPGAGELIAEGVLAIEMAALASDLKLTIHPHPTLSETVMEAAEAIYGQSTHMYRPPRK